MKGSFKSLRDMAKELPFFQFEPGAWDNGNIQMCSRESKGLFIDLCSLYWSRLGELPYALALQKLCNGKEDALKELTDHSIFGVVDGQIVIEFLDEQLDAFGKTSEKRRNAANKRWSYANALQKQSKSNAIREDKKREDKKREEETAATHTPDKGQIFEEIFSDEKFVTDMTINHPGKDLKKAFEECWLYHIQKPSPPEHGWQWRQKLSTWLTVSKTTTNGFNGNGTANKKQQHSRKLAETVVKTYSDVFNGGKDGRSNEASPVDH